MLQRLNNDSNACSRSFYGIDSRVRVVAVLMAEMSLKKHPFNSNFEDGEKSHGANTTDSDHQTPKNFGVICASNCLASWNESPTDNSFAIKECSEHCFDF